MDEQQVINAAELTLEAMEDKVEAIAPEVVRTVNFLKNDKFILASAVAVALGAGAFVGYRLAKKQLETKYEALAEKEIREAREHYAVRWNPDFAKKGYSTPADAVAELITPTEQEAQAAMKVYQGGIPDKAVARIVEVTQDSEGIHVKAENLDSEVQHNNIFVNGDPLVKDDWDYDHELEQRTEDHPYIIHEDEFNENEPDFEDVALTYYAGDGILANEQDEMVDDINALVGERNLKKFGHGTHDRNMLFVRNNKRGLNIEITRSMGKYSSEVLNYDEEEEAMPRRRNRGGDDE